MKLASAIRDAAGVLSLTFLALLAASGWALMAGYVPSDAEAFASVLYWRQAGGLGAAMRSLHYLLASGLVVSGFVHLLLTYLTGRHAAERTSWWLGLTLYLIVLGTCFTGFLLPMDLNAYWGTVVRLGIVETSPVVGPLAADLLRGGGTLNASTLPRFYALHVSLLPFLGFLLLLPLARPMLAADGNRRRVCLGVACAGMAAAYLAAALVPAPLELPAEPTDVEYVPRPEWYFLWLFQFGKYVEAVPWVRSLVLPLAGFGLLYALPLLDRQTLRSRAALTGGWCLAWTGLTALALYADRGLPPKLDYEEALVARAGESYERYCYDCHGHEGKGDGPETRAWDLETPDFTQPEVWQRSSHDEMRQVIENGQGEDMPAFGKQLTSDEIEAMIEFLERSFRPAAEARQP